MCISAATLLLGYATQAEAQTQTQTQTQTPPAAEATSTGDASGKMLEFGVRFMPTLTSFQMQTSGGNTIKGEMTIGYGGGAFVGVNFNENIGIQAELLYFSIAQKNKEQDVTRQVNLRYVNIPVLLSLNTGKSKPVNLNVVAGPQIGVSAGGDVETSGGDGVTEAKAVVVVKNGDVGFAYGAGVDFGLNAAKTFRLGVGFRGVYGLFNISDDSQNRETNEYYILDKAHVKTYSAYVGVSILL